MVSKIRKRDGSVVQFQEFKITEAIWKAVKAVGGTDKEKAERLGEEVIRQLNEKFGELGIPSVEEVQDLVEKILIEAGHAKVAKAYILYRKSHDELRSIKGLFDTIEAVDDYIGLNDWMVKENSNMGFSLQGLNNYIATKIITNYWMRRIYPEAVRTVHESGDLHVHDLGTLGAYCYDDKTKILTEAGWKFFKDVKEGEKVATKNIATREIEFQVPHAKQVYNYSGKMYSYEGRSVSLLVTPEHRLLVRRKGKTKWEFLTPPDFKYGMEFDKTGSWKGKTANFFHVPEMRGGNQKKTIGKIEIKDYLEFMGWFLSEGSVYEPSKGDFRISIAQSRKKYREEICSLLKKMNLHFNDSSEFNIHLHSKELYYYLKQFGKSGEKYLPTNIKELNSDLIKVFLTTLFKGDGSYSEKNKLLKYYTKSEKLAEDVCECLLKIGLCGTITKRKGMNIYMVSVENNHLTPIYRKKEKVVEYSGKVYDFSVKNTTLIVMRNGKIVVSGNCVGWDLKDLLILGFKGVQGKVASKPPKHFRTALGQMVNFFYTLQGETAGAQAFSNVDSLLAPFIRYDNLSYKEVKQSIQEFLFNLAVPTRVGFQCMSEDTEILTPNGWASYNDLKKGDTIKTFNIEKRVIEDKPIRKLFAREYSGIMYNLKNRIQDQLISPGHRVVRKRFQTENYYLEPIEEIDKMKSPFIVPIAGENVVKDSKISDEQIKLMSWIIGEGSIERPGKSRCCYRVSIYQSEIKNNEKYKEIKKLLDHFKLKYSEYTQKGMGCDVKRIRLDAESSKKIHSWFGTKESIKFIPQILLNMSQMQSRLFLETYIKAEGFENCKIATTDQEILDGLQQIAVNSCYGFTVLTRKPTIGKKLIYVLRLINHQDSYIQKIEKINYSGIIWCPNTDNETVIARRNGKVFITGNTPFTNVTMDLKVPEYMKNEPVIIGGKPQKETYKEFQKEMDMFNKAFAEGMLEGDADGRVFTFPIPTYNITKDFDWENPEYEPIWEMTAKYGIPYFSNFINSDMNPEDARSMCPLAGDEKVLIKSSRGGEVEFGEIRNIFKSQKEDYEIYSDGEFVKGTFNEFKNQEMINVKLENGHSIKMSEEHLNFVCCGKGNEEQTIKGKELKTSMYLPYSLKEYLGEGGNNDLGYFVGAYAGDGSFDGDTTVVFSLEETYKKEVIEKLTKIAKDFFSAHVSISKDKDTKLVTLRVHSRAAVGLCKDFVDGKEREKHYRSKLFVSSLEFRKGVLEGHYLTDGGNRNRIYTSSKKMVETLNMLAATLGTTTSIYIDDRERRLGTEPNYSVLFYQLNRESYGNFWFKQDNKLWVKIKEIEKISNTSAYCFEVKESKPIFTVGTTGILTHNCRLRLDQTELRRRGGGLFGANPQTGSIGVVTINMPRLGFISADEKDFLKKLEGLMELAKESLEIKRKAIEKFTEIGLYPYSKFYLNNVHKRFGEYWKNHFATIGLLGMNEAITNFMSGENITTEKGKAFAIRVLDFMREKLQEYQKETGNIYNLEATPGEGTTYRFARIDKKTYGRILVANDKAVKESGAKPYYTNSTQLPVNYTHDVFEALELQDDLQTKYTGGTVFHTFIGEKLQAEGVKKLVRKIAEKFSLPYFTITPTFSVCPKHGYIAGEHYYCPKCDQEIGYVEETEIANRAQVIDAVREKEYQEEKKDAPANY